MSARPAPPPPVSRRSLRLGHLSRRFMGSLRARPLTATEQAWVAQVLTPAEASAFARLGRADQREAHDTARRAATALGARAGGDDDVWLAAALLHDVGKPDARLGSLGRALATAVAAVAGPARTQRWQEEGSGLRQRIGTYAHHDRGGAERLRAAGARPPVVQWAAVHHQPTRWAAAGIPDGIGRILAVADGERVPE